MTLIRAEVERIDTAASQVLLAGHDPVESDQFVIATGKRPDRIRPSA